PPAASRDPGKTTPPTHWDLKTSYPTKRESENLRRRVWRLPMENAGMWAFIGAAYLVVAWMAQSELFGGLASRPSFHQFVWRLAHNPLALLLAVGLVVGLAGFTSTSVPKKKWVLGPAHAVAQLAAMLGVIWGVARICSAIDLSGLGFGLVFILLAGPLGGLVGGEILGAYLLVADRFKLNNNELFAAQRGRDWKNFVRMHIGADGVLTVYPVGIDRTPRDIELAEGAGNYPWLALKDPPLACRLIETPIRIEPNMAPPVAPSASRRRVAATKAKPAPARGAPKPGTRPVRPRKEPT
ncbi:MAG: hypothetical protein H0T70_00570, partial [Acidimicrobiia bacterium]|nr:hypothetical protein [Acidimicrobiia bacterium]